MQRSDRERTLALAGVFQALQLVQQVAYGRPRDTEALEASINSIFKLDADSVDEVYGSVQAMGTGLRLVERQLTGKPAQPDLEITRYAVSLLHLERKLAARKDLLQQLSTGIELALSQADYFSLTHTNVIASLAETYSKTVSTLNPRIMVNGDQHQLDNPDTANWIRALLLAAMRSAVLWRQAGGNRWKLIFGRRRLVAQAQQLRKM